MKPITLKEAELFDREAYLKGVAEKHQKEVDEVIEVINNYIERNLDEIKKKPVHFMIMADIDAIEDACKNYTDFTLVCSRTHRSVSIKLADKDWDWPGYGIKVKQ